jgi:hypothetical protein
MSAPETHPPTGEMPEPAARELIQDLVSFHDSLQNRVQALVVQHWEGPNFGTQINDEESVRDLVELADSYQWALALVKYPYRDREDQGAVSESTVSGLFQAVRAYNPTEHQAFLPYLSQALTAKMIEDHGVPSDPRVPTPADFDAFVEHYHLAALPPLPEQRLPEHFTEGESVLVLEDRELVDGTIQSVTDRENEPITILSPLPPEVIPELQASIEQAYARLAEKNERITLGDPAADTDEILEFEAKMNLRPGQEVPRVELLHALGRLPFGVYAKYPQFIMNPDHGRSTAVVATKANQQGMTVEIKHSSLITTEAWKLLMTDPFYREAYLHHETSGDSATREALEQAIYDRKQAEYLLDHSPRELDPTTAMEEL